MANIANYRTFNYGAHMFFGEFIHFSLMYTTDHIFTGTPIKHLVNQGGEPTTPHKLVTGKNLQYQTYVFYSVHVLY